MVNNDSYNWINKQLRFAIANTYKKSENDISKKFLSTLKEIELPDKGISDLSGIQYAINATSINLSRNNIYDASLLSNLPKLVNLELSENKLENISFLINLKKLKSIGLDCNNISYIPNLKGLKNLKMINISNNKVSDFSFINNLYNKDIKIIAGEQYVFLNPSFVNHGEDYTLHTPIVWNEEEKILLDNVQITGKYNSISTDQRPSLLYSISKIALKNIHSNCLIKADFYHETPFLKSGIFSGVLFQPVLIKLHQLPFNIEKLKKNKYKCIISGKLVSEVENLSLSRKTITLINDKGERIYSLTNAKGEYKFDDLKEGRYTLLFPFIIGCKYKSQSLFVINLKEEEFIEINSSIAPD